MNLAFQFADPRWLWLAVAAPVLLSWLHLRAGRQRARQLAQLASPAFVSRLTASHSPARRRLKEGLILLAFGFAALALARPQWGSTETGNTRLGEDMVFVLDCSLSMATTDVTPNRLERAKFAVLDFVRRQSHGRVGLVAFAGTAYTQCPLTFDTDAFAETLLSLDERTMPIAGTDIGRALNEAYRALDKTGRHKMIVLVTDGEDLEKGGVAAAKSLATNGVVVFTIGVGTPAGKEIQTVNAAGQPALLRDAKGEIVHSRLDEATLREIARATGGSYYPLGPAGDGWLKMHSAMHTLEAANELRRSVRSGVDQFYWPLALALAVMVAEPLITTRRKHLPGRP
jgi:Ca-activated chloride channel family protein